MFDLDLNADLGESFGNYTIGLDQEVIKYVTSANIACGWHAGDPLVMDKTIFYAKDNNVAFGAHPGFPDLMGFGRRNMAVSEKEIKAYTKYQIGALMAFSKSHGVEIQHVKPHGGMYNMAAKDYSLAKGIAEAIYEVDKNLIFLALANSQMVKAGKDVGLRVANEVFADRGYTKDGNLVPRGTEGAMIHDVDVCIKRIVRMVKEKKVTAVTGEDIDIVADSVCVHGDNPEAVVFVKKIRETLKVEGINLQAIKKFI